MKQLIIYIITCILLFTSCTTKRLNERVSLWRNDKIPYGTYYAFKNMVHLFPYSDISINKISPVKRGLGYSGDSKKDSIEGRDRRSAFVVFTPGFKPDEQELDELFKYVTAGNHLFISTFDPGQAFLDSLKLTLGNASSLYNFGDSLVVDLQVKGDSQFVYPGKKLDNFFKTYDTSITNVLGYDGDGHPNFVQFNFKGEGSLVLHLAPLAFSNFFLLHKNNSTYYEQALSIIPNDIEKVYWDDYYRYYEYGRKKGSEGGKNIFSKLGVIMKDEILRWSLFLTVILFALIYLFESKRKQRVIPVIQPLKNASVDFVKTIGRLYYQQKDNSDLAKKMSTYFSDHLRTHYNLHLGFHEQDLARRVSIKTGFSREELARIISTFQLAIAGLNIDDEQLLELNQSLEKFYNHT